MARPLYEAGVLALFAAFLAASNIHQDKPSSLPPMAGSPVARQHPFGSGMALSSKLWFSFAFRLLAFASCNIPFPLRHCPFLAVGLLARRPDLIGVILFRIPERRSGRAPSVRRSLWCVCRGVWIPLFTCGSAPPFHPSFRWLQMTTLRAKVHSRSPCRSSPCPGSGDGYLCHWAFRPSFIPCRYQQRMWDWRPAYTLAGIPWKESLKRCDFQVATTLFGTLPVRQHPRLQLFSASVFFDLRDFGEPPEKKHRTPAGVRQSALSSRDSRFSPVSRFR